MQNFPAFIRLAVVNPSHPHPCRPDQEQIHHSRRAPPHRPPTPGPDPHTRDREGGTHSWRLWAIRKRAELKSCFLEILGCWTLKPRSNSSCEENSPGSPGRSPRPSSGVSLPTAPLQFPFPRLGGAAPNSAPQETPGRPLADAGRGVGPVPPGGSTWPDPHPSPESLETQTCDSGSCLRVSGFPAAGGGTPVRVAKEPGSGPRG